MHVGLPACGRGDVLPVDVSRRRITLSAAHRARRLSFDIEYGRAYTQVYPSSKSIAPAEVQIAFVI